VQKSQNQQILELGTVDKFFCVHHGERLVAQLLQRLLYGTWVVPQ
jgi:hypothetical protein